MPSPPPTPPSADAPGTGKTSVVTSLACPKCAAPLPTPDRRVRFLTCDHCGATMRLRRSHGTITAKRVRRLGRRVDGLSRAVRRLRVEEKLADLDDRWNRRRATLIDGWDEDGKPLPPDRRLAIILTALGGGLVAWGGTTTWLDGVFPFSLWLWVGVVLLIVGVPKWVRAERFRRGRERYQANRTDLERRLSAESGSQPDEPPADPSR